MRKVSGDKYNIYQRLKVSGKLEMVMEEFISRYSDKIMESDGHKRLEQLLQKDKEDYEKKHAEESLKKEIKMKYSFEKNFRHSDGQNSTLRWPGPRKRC